MKKLILILALTVGAFAADKTETDLKEIKKQLAATQAALAASEARAKAIQVGTQKLTDAVTGQTEASKENGKKIEAVSDQIEAAKETVEVQAKLNEKATKKLADTVATQTGHVTSAISEQAQQQAKAVRQARAIERKVDRTNLATTRAQEANVQQITELKQQVEGLKQSISKLSQLAELKEASNLTAIQLAKIQAASSAYAPIATIMIAVFGVVGIWLQSRAGGKLTKISTVQDDIKTQVNGNLSEEKAGRRKAEAENVMLQRQLDSIRGSGQK